MKITVTLTEWQVPFDQVVIGQQTFTDIQAATDYINEAAATWWRENEGDQAVAGGDGSDDWPYSPITELGYNTARFELYGEQGFHAMLDAESYGALCKAHYERKGAVPGFMVNAMLGSDVVPLTEPEREALERQQSEGLAAIEAHYGKRKN